MKALRTLIKFFKNYVALSFLILVFVASSWILFNPKFFRTHDFIHGARIAEMTRALNDGHFPVRWSSNFGYGFGMPLFEFYGPLPYYFGSAFYLSGFDLVTSIKLIILLCNLGSLFGAFYLGKNLVGTRGGILLAATFTLAPYRAVNLYVRGSIGEAWGMMTFPWILLGINLIIKEKSKRGWLILTLSLVTLFLSHNLTTLIFIPFTLLYGAGFLIAAKPKFPALKKIMLQLAGSYALAGSLSSFYLFPALLEKNQTVVDSILGGYFHYFNHFLYIRQFVIPKWGYGGSGWGANDGISFFLGTGQLLALLISFLVFLFYSKKHLKENWPKPKLDFKIIFYLSLVVLLTLSLFMTTFKSNPIWENLKFLAYIQFPWRFLSAAAMFTALLGILPLVMMRNPLAKFTYFVVIFFLTLCINFSYFRPEAMMADATVLYYSDEDKIRTTMSSVLSDYIPIGMDKNEVLSSQFRGFTFPAGTTTLIKKTHQHLYEFNLKSEQVVPFPIANFPGWQVEIDGQRVTTFSSTTGLVAATIPSGKHQVGVIFSGSNIRQIADIISAVALLALCYLLIHQRQGALTKHDYRRHPHPLN